MNWKIYDADGELINTIYADQDFVEQYCKENDCTYELEMRPPVEAMPTAQEQLRADIDFIAVMTGVTL